MNLKEFVKQVIEDTVQAVDEASAGASRQVTLIRGSDNKRTIEFDVAVSAEEKTSTEGKAGVRVLGFVEAGGNVGTVSTNSTVSRITFGVDVSQVTKQDVQKLQAQRSIVQRNSAR